MHRDSWFVVVDEGKSPCLVVGDAAARHLLRQGTKLVRVVSTESVTEFSLDEWPTELPTEERKP
jgi:hypothetical protein